MVWARLLAVHLGTTTKGHTVVIATFMGGLGLGYALFGRLSDRSERPLRLYASLEGAIALSALLTPMWVSWTEAFPWLSVLCILLPTTLMGGTLPALTSALAQRETPGPTIAWLYGVNALGAVGGVLWAGFWAVEHLGVLHTNHVAAGLNALLALFALYLGRGQPRRAALEARESIAAHWVVSATLAAATIGFVSLALQGAWMRLFAVIFGSSSYALSLVLAAFILGIALGSLVVRRWLHAWRPLGPLVGVALLTAAALWLTGPLFERLPYLVASLRSRYLEHPDGFMLYGFGRFGLAFLVLLGPTTLFGALLPLSARLAAKELPGAGTGRIFAANTVGAVLGAALSLPVLVPWLGLDGVHQLGVWLMLVCAALLGASMHASVDTLHRRLAYLGVVLLSVGVVIAPTSWDPQVIGSGAFRMKGPGVGDAHAFAERAKRSTLLFHQDGADATVSVLERKGDRVLMVNGKPDASTRGDMVTQVMSAHVPLALHDSPDEVLVIGHGSGVTAGSALLHPEVSLDIIEVSKAVMDASSYFDAWSGAPLASPRAEVIVDDVRSALRDRPARRWDVIISEPSNPWVAGNAGLFSTDFFALLASRLHNDGLVAQWVQRYETDDDTLLMVLRSFASAFEHVEVFQLYPTDLLLIGRDAATAPALDELARRLSVDAVANDLKRVGLPGLAGLASLHALTSEGVRALLAAHPGPVNTAARPRLEFEAPRRLFRGERAAVVSKADRRGLQNLKEVSGSGLSQPERSSAPSPGDQGLWARVVQHTPPTLAALEALFIFHTTYPGAPPGFRLDWVPRLAAESAIPFVIELGFTLVTERRWGAFEAVEARLRTDAADIPKALYLRASALATREGRPALSPAESERLQDLLTRCLALGDEPRGRCERERRRLADAQTR